MRLSTVDLNLLVAFDALHREGSVSRAARRVGLSPSAMSHSLARLRELFEDPLFVRAGIRMTPTPRAEAISHDVRAALEHVESALESPSEFRPEASKQTFRVGASNDVQVAILPYLLPALRDAAPDVRVDVADLPTRDRMNRDLASGDLDLSIGYLDRLPSSLHRRKLFETRIVSVASGAHPRIRGHLGLEQYLREGHVAIVNSGPIGLLTSPDGLLKRDGLRRRVVSEVSNPEVALLVVAQSDLLCSATELMVTGLAHLAVLQVLEHPLKMPRLSVSAAWHARTHTHRMHQWFRELVFRIAARWDTAPRRQRPGLHRFAPH